MLWNWNTVDACFISRDWQITSKGMFAGCCIGVLLLVMAVELLRRLGKEYDAYLYRQFRRRAAASASEARPLKFKATPLEQLIRAVIHAVTFGAAYIVMLLAMYYNGYFIICIFLGAGLGKFACDWFVVEVDGGDVCAGGGACGESSGAGSEKVGSRNDDSKATTICCA